MLLLLFFLNNNYRATFYYILDETYRFTPKRVHALICLPDFAMTGLPVNGSSDSTRVSFVVIWIRISDPRSLRSLYIKGTDESTLVTDSSVSLMHHDSSDLGSLILIQITPKERIFNDAQMWFFTTHFIYPDMFVLRFSISVTANGSVLVFYAPRLKFELF